MSTSIPVKLDLIRNRKSPILEEGIQELMRDVVDSGRVSVTNDAMLAMRDSEMSFVCVGTPSAANGSQDLTAILRLAEQIGAALALKEEFHTIVIRSTVQPGTVEEKIEPILERASGKKSGVDFGLCFQPEFLREGTSIRDYDHPPYTIVGGNCEAAVNAVRDLFQHLDARFLVTNIRVAEALKMSCNAFHALKITFANEIGRVSQALGIDSHEVMRLVCADKRLNISPAYLKPGFAFGGSCLPKDLRALTNIAKQNDIELPMLSSLLAEQSRPHRTRGRQDPGAGPAEGRHARAVVQDRHRRSARIAAGDGGQALVRRGLRVAHLRSGSAALAVVRRQPQLHRRQHSASRIAVVSDDRSHDRSVRGDSRRVAAGRAQRCAAGEAQAGASPASTWSTCPIAICFAATTKESAGKRPGGPVPTYIRVGCASQFWRLR